ncbi:hypothetical protein A7K94_0200760 [Modestobacter sp. VKM Ac-2676]|nr:hypothetical protein A7K94_0200760 [Modestobacter sp. VKM Ac-2676]
MDSVSLAGVRLVATCWDEAIEAFSGPPLRSDQQIVRFINAVNISMAYRDSDYAALLGDPRSVNIPDGRALRWAVRFTNRSPVELSVLPGPDFFRRSLAASTSPSSFTGATPPRHFFVGRDASLLDNLTAAARTLNPAVQIVGTYAPPFAPVDQRLALHVAERVRTSNATSVWLGIGTPRQDELAKLLADLVPTMRIYTVGAAMEFLTGDKRRAPSWVRQAGAEWLFRMLQEPRRLGRRYAVGNTVFVALVIRQAISRRREDANSSLS